MSRKILVSSYNEGEVSVAASMQRLQTHIDALPGRLQNFSSEELLSRPAPGKWSKQEIVGHLVDSAINNLKRFTEIQFSPQPYTLMPYNQNELVDVNNYQAASLTHVLQLWQSLNRQIIHSVNSIPPQKLEFKVSSGNDEQEAKTLAWLIADYVGHMEHHFKQIFV